MKRQYTTGAIGREAANGRSRTCEPFESSSVGSPAPCAHLRIPNSTFQISDGDRSGIGNLESGIPLRLRPKAALGASWLSPQITTIRGRIDSGYVPSSWGDFTTYGDPER